MISHINKRSIKEMLENVLTYLIYPLMVVGIGYAFSTFILLCGN